MGKSKSPELPPTPSFYQDPVAQGATQNLYQQGLNATSFNGLPPMLMEALSTSPDVTRLTLEGLQAQLAPQLRQSRQDVVNQLEANNQLTGSTTASALGNIQSDYESQLVNAGAQAGLADINRALQNRIGLYGTGLNALQAAGQMGQTNQSQQNSFSLANYENQVAAIMNSQKNQGGIAGALSGGLGGAVTGFALTGNPFGALAGGAIGAAGGYYGPSGTGGALASAGAGLYGARLASNNPYQVTSQSSSPVFSGEQINNTLQTPSWLSNPGLYGANI